MLRSAQALFADIAPSTSNPVGAAVGLIVLDSLIFFGGLALLQVPRRKLLSVSVPVGGVNVLVGGLIAWASYRDHELPPAVILAAAILHGLLGFVLVLRPFPGSRRRDQPAGPGST
jgi:hypothetical protein